MFSVTANLSQECRWKLSTYSDYAMRVMMHLAARNDGLTSIRQVAAIYDISQNHLMKVVQELAALLTIITDADPAGS